GVDEHRDAVAREELADLLVLRVVLLGAALLDLRDLRLQRVVESHGRGSYQSAPGPACLDRPRPWLAFADGTLVHWYHGTSARHRPRRRSFAKSRPVGR